MATTTNNGWVTPDNTAYVKDGASAIRSLGQSIDTSVGTGLLAWTAYTPTLTNATLGNGTLTAYYAKLGKIVITRIKFTLGSTSSIGTEPLFSLPVNKASTWFNFYDIAGPAYFNDSGTAQWHGACRLRDTNNIQPMFYSVSASKITPGTVSSVAPMTWTTNDELLLQITYEAV